jgi:hypothetical protein
MPKKNQAKTEERHAEHTDQRAATPEEVREAVERGLKRNKEALTELAKW